ncbi:putative oxidoreductase C-terminal domain-containing protein [Xanthocytophaga agilis]|uniref:Oxidoreductase C-terminal domain-containing protein n=1 Tax=Xanthocytophaga agilis TaxID=3048010 RepID=A0AAE3R0E3_9BACT|nr:putative oxidoreductase C-terminal domain-containing protein [Xanthocytophaga agilis]MDJ1499317.1 putative oxidoreductase C-terminal domain-containing protein [Xanthocytophaga agilis]
MKHFTKEFWIVAIALLCASCNTTHTDKPSQKSVKLITLDPGHFHAALVQKKMYAAIDSVVSVFAPDGLDVEEHLKRIDGYNRRSDDPTHWKESVYTGNDYLEKMLTQKPGNVVVIAGNNGKKSEYIQKSVDAGLHVLADKPMCIDSTGFQSLLKSFDVADRNKVLLYDIMTERSEITTILQKELSQIPDIFGKLKTGSAEEPAVTKESIHHFYKYVSRKALKRPAWFMDVTQQGEGLVDVTTHLVDLVQWECFPEQVIDYTKDIHVLKARRWPTPMTQSQFSAITGMTSFPDFLKKDVSDSVLSVFSNGEITYQIKGVYAKVSVIWNYQAPEGAGDTHYSIMRGDKANLVIRQNKEENYIPQLYIESSKGTDLNTYGTRLTKSFEKITQKYPGVGLQKQGDRWIIQIPDTYRIGHEAHFAEVMERFLQYLKDGKLPEWEVPNMKAKYYTTTTALQLAKRDQPSKSLSFSNPKK